MSEPNGAVREIASYIAVHTRRDGGGKAYSWGLQEPIAKYLQQMVDEGRIKGGLVVTGDHEEGDKTVLDWEPLTSERTYSKDEVRELMSKIALDFYKFGQVNAEIADLNGSVETYLNRD